MVDAGSVLPATGDPPDPQALVVSEDPTETPELLDGLETQDDLETTDPPDVPEKVAEMEMPELPEPLVAQEHEEPEEQLETLDPTDEQEKRDPQETPDALGTPDDQDPKDHLDPPVLEDLPALLVNLVVEDNPEAQERTPSTAHAQEDQDSSKPNRMEDSKHHQHKPFPDFNLSITPTPIKFDSLVFVEKYFLVIALFGIVNFKTG
jgi:hypothetical protein